MIHIEELEYKANSASLINEVNNNIVVLDGAMGTMIQKYNLSETDFRGNLFHTWQCNLKGCNDILCLTAPHIIKEIHLNYLNAGASIIETNSFNANAFSLADYALENEVEAINLAAAKIAREAADEYIAQNPGKSCWIAGSVGPSNKSLSMASTLEENISWDTLVDTYITQMRALIRGGVDALLIETIFDTLNAKAATYAARRAMEMEGVRVPLMISATLTETGRTLSGQTLDAFVASISHCEPISIGLNCGFGADTMAPHIEALQSIPFAVSMHANAGLPNEMGEYDETPETMASKIKPLIERGLVNIIGGCCGTTPAHIAAIANIVKEENDKRKEKSKALLHSSLRNSNSKSLLAGLESFEISPERNFVNVGERCNVAGSRKFLRLINEGNISEALQIACSQVEAGAQIIDINMDDAMLDAEKEMAHFITKLEEEPQTARVPFMIDSSKWEVITSALKLVQGKAIVNSISLKEGEEAFISKARHIREMGAAVVVMAFDEKGQADTFNRRIEICSRAYEILTTKVNFPACDIIFDPNILAVATGIEQHNSYALDFIRATEWIKQNLPGAKVSGGVSNLSFSFRGNNYIREAMHALFLYHAINVGMDMAIVNAASLMPVDEIPQDVKVAIEDVLFNRDNEATTRLIEIAQRIKEEKVGEKAQTANASTESLSPHQHIERMILRGNTDAMEQHLQAVLSIEGNALNVINNALMPAMNTVGKLFGEGKLFLPQVVKSAQTMKCAVDILTPIIENEKGKSNEENSLNSQSSTINSKKIILATVKGDVHDIGKNIVAVILSCNGFEVIDMGVMVPAEDIIAKAIECNADFIGLSGLITPSLDEMCHVAQLMQQHKMQIPLLIGGATASEMHTAVKIAPCYSGSVIYIKDAAMIPAEIEALTNPQTREGYIKTLNLSQSNLRQQHALAQPSISIEEARRHKFIYGDDVEPTTPQQPGVHTMLIAISDARKLINWRAFFAVWKLDAAFAEIATINGCDHCRAQWLAGVSQEQRSKAAEAMQLFKEANLTLDYLEKKLTTGLTARVVLMPAGSRDEDIIYLHNETTYALPTPRQLRGEAPLLALADFVKPIGDDGELTDYIGAFAVTCGLEMQQMITRWHDLGEEYKALLYQVLADRLAEAATEIMYHKVRESSWRFEAKGIRPAIGFPSLPDQRLVFLADKVLNYAELGISLTENGALYPTASTTGYIIAHPKARYFIV